MISPCIFIDIDTQNDFFDPKGAMPIKGAEEIRENLKRLTQHAEKRKIKIIAGVELYDGKESAENRKFCYAGTRGQKKITETQVKNACVIPPSKKAVNYEGLLKKCKQIILEKGDFKFFGNPHALKLLKKTKIKNCIVYGVAIDYGVEQVVLNLIENGFKVWIPVDAVKPINEGNREPVMKELRAKGAEMWNTDFIISNT
jgi:nicotinamidase-related amidase